MRCSVELPDTRIDYTLVRSAKRRRTIGITIEDSGEVMVRAPVRASRAVIADIVRRKARWIERRQAEITQRPPAAQPAFTAPQREELVEHARIVLGSAVLRWAERMGCAPGPVLVRDQKRIWGSCARDGTIRLNWRLVLLPADLIDYVVVHELTHLTVRNHQPEFWAAVATVLPDYKQRRSRLRHVRL
jgi:predicted metal-dependent hydrolase